MKQKLSFRIGAMVLAALLTAVASAQSLGDYARQQRAQKSPAPAGVKTFTNENLPASGGMREAGAAPSAPGAEPSASSEAVPSAAPEATGDREKLKGEWQARVKAAKNQIALLEREAQIRKDELNWRPITAALQFDTRIAGDDQKRRSEAAQMEKELAAARQKLEDLRDELRKKDLPRSWGD